LVDDLKGNKDVVKAIIEWPSFTGLIIGWEAPPRKAINPKEFNIWLDSTKALFKDKAGVSMAPKSSSRRKIECPSVCKSLRPIVLHRLFTLLTDAIGNLLHRSSGYEDHSVYRFQITH